MKEKAQNILNSRLFDVMYEGRFDLAQVLVENGADVDAKDKFGKTIYAVAQEIGRDDIVEFISAHSVVFSPLNMVNQSKKAFELVKMGDVASLEKLLTNNSFLKFVDENHDTLLILACKTANFKMINFLLGRINSEPENKITSYILSKNKRKMDALQEISRRKLPKALELLLEFGANPNTVDGYGWTPLMRAVGENDVESVESLIIHGANINYNHNEEMLTPLMWCCLRLAVESGLRLLEEEKIDVNMQDVYGRTALSLLENRRGVYKKDEYDTMINAIMKKGNNYQ